MRVDKDFTYQVIRALRETGADSRINLLTFGYHRDLMLVAANLVEINIRAYLDLLEHKEG